MGEFLKSRTNRGRRPDLFFWRDHTGNEVDLLAGSESELLGVEIKSGATVVPDWSRGLAFLQKVSGVALTRAEIYYGGERRLPCGIAQAVPWTALAGDLGKQG